jgi:hypothetical protein
MNTAAERHYARRHLLLTSEEQQAARKAWPGDEGTDFLIEHVTGADSSVWIRLKCSAHGPVATAAKWELDVMNTAAERHYARWHLRGTRA